MGTGARTIAKHVAYIRPAPRTGGWGIALLALAIPSAFPCSPGDALGVKLPRMEPSVAGKAARYDAFADWYVTGTETWPARFVCDRAVGIMVPGSMASAGWMSPVALAGLHVSSPDEALRSSGLI